MSAHTQPELLGCWEQARGLLKTYVHCVGVTLGPSHAERITAVHLIIIGSALICPMAGWSAWPALVLLCLAAVLATHVLVYSASVALVTQRPRMPFRSAILTFVGFVQVTLSFAVWYRIALSSWLCGTPQFVVGETIRDLRFTEAIYFAVVTGTTTGFGDIHPVPAAWGAMVGVTIQLLASVFYLMIVLATVIQWASQPKRP